MIIDLYHFEYIFIVSAHCFWGGGESRIQHKQH